MSLRSIPDKKTIEKLREQYKENTRIELLSMDDRQAPPVHTKGTVKGVDDIGNILVNWDNGSSLSIIYGVDVIRIISES